jgi:hypothetical protein
MPDYNHELRRRVLAEDEPAWLARHPRRPYLSTAMIAAARGYAGCAAARVSPAKRGARSKLIRVLSVGRAPVAIAVASAGG